MRRYTYKSNSTDFPKQTQKCVFPNKSADSDLTTVYNWGGVGGDRVPYRMQRAAPLRSSLTAWPASRPASRALSHSRLFCFFSATAGSRAGAPLSPCVAPMCVARSKVASNSARFDRCAQATAAASCCHDGSVGSELAAATLVPARAGHTGRLLYSR